MASQQAREINELLRQLKKEAVSIGEVSVEDMRRNSAHLGALASTPEGVTWSAVNAGGIAALWAEPARSVDDRVLQYLHGAGYVDGSAEMYKNFAGHLANATGCRVLSVDYGLAPEHPHPGPLNDSVSAFRWLQRRGFKAEHAALAGEASGGGLTLATLLKLRDDGLGQPAAAALISPWTDMESQGESIRTNADRDVCLSPATLRARADLFLSGSDPRDPLASPLYGDYTGICALYIQVGADEILLDDARRIVDGAREAGVEVKLEVFPEMQHEFQLAAGNMPEADIAVAKIGVYLRSRLGLA